MRPSATARRWGRMGAAVVLVAALAAAGPPPDARAALGPAARCQAGGLAAVARALVCRTRRAARAERTGGVADVSRCSRRLARRLAKLDHRLGPACDLGAATADLEAELARVVEVLTTLVASPPLAEGGASCRALTLAAGSRLGRCRLGVVRRALSGRSGRDDADCDARLLRQLRRAERRGGDGCRATAARSDAVTLVAVRVDALVALVASSATTTSTSVTAASTSTTLVPATCGNGTLEPPEECDDGGRVDGDGCSAACTLEDRSALCAGVPMSAGTDVAAELVTAGLDQPNGATAPALDPRRLFVVEQSGRIRIVEDGVLLAEPFLDLHEAVSCCGERGLLGLAFHPDYERNGRFFVDYTDDDGDTVIARYTVDPLDPRRADPTSAQVLLRIDQPFPNHNGGQLAFGPDGYLYVGTGDGGGGGDPLEAAQSDASLLGKLLRLDVDVEARPWWTVPPSNPRHLTGSDPLELVWAKGLRNPWRFAFDRGTGDLYIGDVGQSEHEEIDLQPAASPGGENYGWDVFEASACYDDPDSGPDCPSPSADFTFPIHEYTHDEGCSVTGGYAYRGCALPALHGRYFYADWCGGWIRSFMALGGSATSHADHTAALDPAGNLSIRRITSFGEDARGELYVMDGTDGELFRVVPASTPGS